MVEYHSNDFDLYEWAEEAKTIHVLPDISEYRIDTNEATSNQKLEMYHKKWDDFYSNHNSGKFFKPRRYLIVEFGSYLTRCGEMKATIVEAGCGHGCSMYPIIEKFSVNYIATDFSAEVIHILERDGMFDKSRSSATLWDVTLAAPEPLGSLIKGPVGAVMSIFTLSAVHPSKHIASLQNMRSLLLNHADPSLNGVILFRDYGIHDMTMYRHKLRYSDTLFGRTDGTLSYYFDLDYLRSIAEAAGLYVLELEYATVRTANRKKGTEMRRVFVHAVLSIHPPSSAIV